MANPHSFIDTHCHFDFPDFSDLETQWRKAQQAGVKRIVIPAIGTKNWASLQQLSKQYPSLYYSLGFHPYFLNQHPNDIYDVLNHALLQRDKHCVAVGECGLDFMLHEALLTPENITKQYTLFESQVELAAQHHLPLIIHSRKAHDKIVARLKQVKPEKGGVIHAFSGSYQQALEYVKLGFYIGVGGVITYPRANKTRQAIAKLPLESLVLETDAPDMPVSGFQGQANHPAHLASIFSALCELRSENEMKIEQLIWHNSCILFGWD